MSGYNPFFDPTNRPLGRTKVTFSRQEIQHLALAVLALGVGLSFVLANGGSVVARLNDLMTRPIVAVAAFLAVSTGFVLHELAHKIVAIKYGCMAEFRASMSGLGISVLIAVLAKFLFAAPGAVHIYGRVDNRENGLISLVGPGTNLTISAICLPFAFILDGNAQYVFYVVSFANALLAGFNLLPFSVFDGRKIMAWNRVAWGVAMVLALALFVIAALIPNLAI